MPKFSVPWSIPGKKAPVGQWPAGEFDDRLSALLRAAAVAGVTQGKIATVLESHVNSIRLNAAMNVNLNTTPRTYDATSGRVINP